MPLACALGNARRGVVHTCFGHTTSEAITSNANAIFASHGGRTCGLAGAMTIPERECQFLPVYLCYKDLRGLPDCPKFAFE